MNPRALFPFPLLALIAACGSGRSPAPPAQPRTSVEAPESAGSVQTLSGQVLGVDRVPVADQNQLTLRLRATPGSDAPVSVDLGPGWYFDEHGIHFETHEHVTVRGTEHHHHGKSVIVAEEITKGGKTYRLDHNRKATPPGDEPSDESSDSEDPPDADD